MVDVYKKAGLNDDPNRKIIKYPKFVQRPRSGYPMQNSAVHVNHEYNMSEPRRAPLILEPDDMVKPKEFNPPFDFSYKDYK